MEGVRGSIPLAPTISIAPRPSPTETLNLGAQEVYRRLIRVE